MELSYPPKGIQKTLKGFLFSNWRDFSCGYSILISLIGKRAALNEKVKYTRRLKTEVKNVKRKLTDLKLRHDFGSTQQAKFRKCQPRLGNNSWWNSHRAKDLGLNTPIASRNALGNLSNLFLLVFADHKSIGLVLYILNPLYHHVPST